MEKAKQELYRIIQTNHLWTVGSKSKQHFSECNIKNKWYLLSRKSQDLGTCTLRRLTDCSKTQHQSLRMWFQCYRCFTENKHFRSLSLHLLPIEQTSVRFSIKLAESSLVLNMAPWAVLAWLMRQPIIKQRAETNHISSKAPLASNPALSHTVRLNLLKTPPSHRSDD